MGLGSIEPPTSWPAMGPSLAGGGGGPGGLPYNTKHPEMVAGRTGKFRVNPPGRDPYSTVGCKVEEG